MYFDQNVITGTEKRIFALRTLYREYGYRPYRMSKFEDYDLYSRNKDFLLSDRVITFTDVNGRLKALKPDVTLSIVKNLDDRPSDLQKLYYDENVYRASDKTNSFREIMQMGIECIGDAGNASVTEVMELAVKSLELLSEGRDFLLKVSDIDILTAIAEDITGNDRGRLKKELFRCAGEKNIHGIKELCEAEGIDENSYMPLIELIKLQGGPDKVMERLAGICGGTAAEAEVTEFSSVLAALGEAERSRVKVDFSIISDTNYYNGLALEGYIDSIPEFVLVGGRYDMLMQRMHRKSRAVGFAVYLDTLSGLGRYAGDVAIENFFENAADAVGDSK